MFLVVSSTYFGWEKRLLAITPLGSDRPFRHICDVTACLAVEPSSKVDRNASVRILFIPCCSR